MHTVDSFWLTVQYPDKIEEIQIRIEMVNSLGFGEDGKLKVVGKRRVQRLSYHNYFSQVN